MPPSCETRHALPNLCFQFPRCFLDISPQVLGLGGCTCAAAAAFSVVVIEMFKLTTAPSIRPNWPQCPPHCWDQRGETQKNSAS